MKKLILIIILTAPLIVNSQARFILNDSVFVTMSDSVYLVIDNADSNAITTTGTGGNIISESEVNVVQWNIADSSDATYIVPFTTNTTRKKIPLEVKVTSAGSNDGSILFSTYETATDMNTTWPSDVTHMNSGILGGADGSLFAVDRFWMIDANSYTTKPNVEIQFTYDSSANELKGTNTITEANLAAQYFDTTNGGDWSSLNGGSNLVNRTVSPVYAGGTNFFKTWTLVDNSTPLPIDELRFYAEKENDYSVLGWVTSNEKNISHFDIERSIDGKAFSKIGEVKSGLEYVFYDQKPVNGINYYRLKLIDNEGDFTYSEVKEVIFTNDILVSLFPNPTNNYSSLKITGEYKELKLTVYDLKGRLIKNSTHYNQNSIELEFVNQLADGMYHINLTIDNYISKNLKLVKNN